MREKNPLLRRCSAVVFHLYYRIIIIQMMGTACKWFEWLPQGSNGHWMCQVGRGKRLLLPCARKIFLFRPKRCRHAACCTHVAPHKCHELHAKMNKWIIHLCMQWRAVSMRRVLSISVETSSLNECTDFRVDSRCCAGFDARSVRYWRTGSKS